MTDNAAVLTDVRLSDIGQIAINVHDVDAATAFYRDTLSMQHLFNAPRMAFFQCGSVRLMLGIAETPEFDHPSSVIYYRVGDIGAAHRTLAGRGVVFEGEPHCVHRAADYELWLAFFRDPDRNFLALMEERKTTGA
jgi:methylmalonyl-CoA/ethylmalonyl-CoA epimerase